MPHLHRFFHPAGPPVDGEALLSPEESHHAMRVIRVRTGDAVALFDGRGHAWHGTIAELARNAVRVAVTGEDFTPRPEPRITLVQAWLHRDKLLDELVRQATALGVDRFCFFRADHSEKEPRIHEKWERVAVEVCKQTGRRWLPEYVSRGGLRDVLDNTRGENIVVAAMEGPHRPLAALDRARPVMLVVGPEGDFSPAELDALRHAGAHFTTLGDYTLRSEAAAIAGLTLIQHTLGRMG